MKPRELAEEAIGLYEKALQRNGVVDLLAADSVAAAKAQAIQEFEEEQAFEVFTRLNLEGPDISEVVDLSSFSEAAQLFYDYAFSRGVYRGEQKEQHRAGVNNARDMLVIAEQLLRNADTPNIMERQTWAACARMALRRTPGMNVTTEIDAALAEMTPDRTPSQGQVQIAFVYVQRALEKLR